MRGVEGPGEGREGRRKQGRTQARTLLGPAANNERNNNTAFFCIWKDEARCCCHQHPPPPHTSARSLQVPRAEHHSCMTGLPARSKVGPPRRRCSLISVRHCPCAVVRRCCRAARFRAPCPCLPCAVSVRRCPRAVPLRAIGRTRRLRGRGLILLSLIHI